MQMEDFIKALSSVSPTPGGGGASALVGAVGVALCAMVANLTSGKKRYAGHQADIDRVLTRTDASIQRLLALIQEDAEVFEPLARAYGIPRDQPGRDDVLERALAAASEVPLRIMREVAQVLDILDILMLKGSKLAISDVGVAASALRCAIQGAALNVFINTKLMKDRAYATRANAEAQCLLDEAGPRCDRIYMRVAEGLVRP